MVKVKRYRQNPILTPDEEVNWEAVATFNGCPIRERDKFHFLYRALSSSQHYFGYDLELSSIGYAVSDDGIHFRNRRLLISPEYQWEEFGCEDPKVTRLNDKYFIFYTALGDYPLTPPGIKIGLAITKNFEEIEEKHRVTYFNSKAMALFPERIKGKMVAILTVNTDQPPAAIAVAFFDEESQLWSKEYWDHWLALLNKQALSLQRDASDHVEVGAPPIKTEKGWLLIYSYIKNYFSPPATYGIEAVLLDLENPLKIVGRTKEPLLAPKEEYELYGKVPNVIFPSGALVQNEKLHLYYGAADTTCCLASLELKDLMNEMLFQKSNRVKARRSRQVRLIRDKGNPIISPNSEYDWESRYTFNPAAVYEGGQVHLIYRAMGDDETSVLGYASSRDGLRINERLPEPIYVPREDFEKKLKPGYSGCEDPRITKVGDWFYMCYTAYDGRDPTKVVLTSIKVADFLGKRWNWTKPIVISGPGRSDKNACLMPEKIKGQYVFFHRIGGCIWVDFVDDLRFSGSHRLGGKMIFCPRLDKWDSKKVGIGPPPIKTQAGWLLIYHGLSRHDQKYRLGALLLDLDHPDQILSQLDGPILEPVVSYERVGLRPETVFSCGAVVIKDKLFVYYGAADEAICVATTDLSRLMEALSPP